VVVLVALVLLVADTLKVFYMALFKVLPITILFCGWCWCWCVRVGVGVVVLVGFEVLGVVLSRTISPKLVQKYTFIQCTNYSKNTRSL
jgi:hypothetical protein